MPHPDPPLAVWTSRDCDGVMTVWFDARGRSVNTLSVEMWSDLDRAMGEVESAKPVGVIFASAKPTSFIAGADLFEMQAMDDSQLDLFLAKGQRILDRIAALAIPTVAAINGDALGGGLELALACQWRIAIDEPPIQIGLPESTLGLVPGWGGMIRLPRLVGLAEALKIMVTGKSLSPADALTVGLLDGVVSREMLLPVARAWATQRRPAAVPPMAGRDSDAGERGIVCDRFRSITRQRSGDNLPAAIRLVDTVELSYTQDHAAASDAERRALIELRSTEAGRNLMRLFFLRVGAKKAALADAPGESRSIRSAVVIGGGTMGAGIAHSLARAGISVTVIEADGRTAALATARIAGLTGDDSIHVTTDWTAIASADLVVEAVVEQMAAKVDIFGRIDALAQPEAVLASNTSSLSVAAIAIATKHPERVIGLHFFNPVSKMPLVEVVRTPLTDGNVLATGVAVAICAGKTPIVVNDAPGFLVNRVLFPYLREAISLFTESGAILPIDSAIKAWGMPMGPLELMDEIGLDVGRLIFDSLSLSLGPRLSSPSILEQAINRGWLGKKSGCGFYLYRKEEKPVPNPEFLSLTGLASPNELPAAIVQQRLMKPMAEEARLVLKDGVVKTADAIDLATVLGLGFAPFRGGLASFAGLTTPITYTNRR